LSSYLEVPVLSDSGEHDICQTRREGLADVNKDLRAYCSPLAFVSSYGIAKAKENVDL
jgi:hypothetical protein